MLIMGAHYVVLGALIYGAGKIGQVLYPRAKVEVDPEECYHIGVETGGTTCKVGIIKGTKD